MNWGNWDYGGGNGMRVGVQATAEAVSPGEAGCTVTVEYWTDNQYSYNDSQTLSFGGSIGGSTSFTNNDGATAVKRATKTYTYTYTSSGASPGTRTFSATLSGAYNGVSPSGSDTVTIPARPISSPAAVTAQTVTRIDDQSSKITWVNHATSTAPYNYKTQVDRLIYAGTLTSPPFGGASWDTIVYVTETATNYTDTTVVPNRKYQYRIYARNTQGNASAATTSIIYTAPAAPTAVTRTTVGADQQITWVNNVYYDEYAIEVWHAVNGVWDAAALPGATSLAAGTTTFTHTAPAVGVRHSYRVIAKTTSGTVLYSAYSAETDATAGTTIAPLAPTNLVPASPTVVDYSAPIVFTWKHNPADGSGQTNFLLQHRVVGSNTWTSTPMTASTASTYTLSPNPYLASTSVEWQVQTWGSDSTLAGAMSATATFTTSALVAKRYPVYLDVTSGQLQADSSPPPAPVVPAPSIDPATSCLRIAAAPQTLSTGVDTTLTLATVSYNVGCDTSVANTIKIVTPGLYSLAASGLLDNGPVARRMLWIAVNGTSVARSETKAMDTAEYYTGVCNAHVYLNAGDLVTLFGYQNSGSGLVTLGTYYPRLSVALMANQGAQGPKGDTGARGAASAAPLIEAYTTPGSYTWTRTSGAVRVEVIAISGGAGGGSGRAGAPLTIRAGGGGGAGGMRVTGTFDANDLGATENVTVGAGGAGGASVATSDTNGLIGVAGAASYFGSAATNRWIGANTPAAGAAGAVAAAAGGVAAGPGGSSGAASSATGAAGTTSNNQLGRGTSWSAGAGAGGGGVTAADVASAGGTGGPGVTGSSTAPLGGTLGGGAGAAGVAARTGSRQGGDGGGGGGGSITTAAGKGGDGGFPGGGGGGGGAALNSFASGAGGKGGDGAVYVITYF